MSWRRYPSPYPRHRCEAAFSQPRSGQLALCRDFLDHCAAGEGRRGPRSRVGLEFMCNGSRASMPNAGLGFADAFISAVEPSRTIGIAARRHRHISTSHPRTMKGEGGRAGPQQGCAPSNGQPGAPAPGDTCSRNVARSSSYSRSPDVRFANRRSAAGLAAPIRASRRSRAPPTHADHLAVFLDNSVWPCSRTQTPRRTPGAANVAVRSRAPPVVM